MKILSKEKLDNLFLKSGVKTKVVSTFNRVSQKFKSRSQPERRKKFENKIAMGLPLEIHEIISKYLSIADIIEISRASKDLRAIYLPFSYHHITVIPSKFSGVDIIGYSKTRQIPLNVFLRPKKYSWYLPEHVQHVLFMDWCFSKMNEKAINSFIKMILQKHKDAENNYLISKTQSNESRRASVSFGFNFTDPEITMFDLTTSDDQRNTWYSNTSTLVTETEKGPKKHQAIRTVYPFIQTFRFNQVFHTIANKNVSTFDEASQKSISVKFAPNTNFLDLIPNTHIQLLEIASLQKLKNYCNITTLELFLGEQKYYKGSYTTGTISEESQIELTLLTSDCYYSLLKLINNMANLENFTFYPPTGISLSQYEGILDEVDKLPKIRQVETGHYYTHITPTIDAVLKLPINLDKCSVNLLVLNILENHFRNTEIIDIPQITHFEIHVGLDWNINPQDIHNKITRAIRFPNLRHFIDRTGFVPDTGSFFLNIDTMSQLSSLQLVLKSQKCSALNTMIPLVFNGIGQLKSLQRMCITELEFCGFENEMFKTEQEYSIYRDVIMDIGDIYNSVINKAGNVINLADRNHEMGYMISPEFYESFDKHLSESVPNLKKRTIPVKLLLDSLLNPEKVIKENYKFLAWPRMRLNKPSNLTFEQQENYWYIMHIIVNHCFWEVMFLKLRNLEKLEYLEIQRMDRLEQGYRFYDHGQGLNILNLPRFHDFVIENHTIKQVCFPNYKYCNLRGCITGTWGHDSIQYQRLVCQSQSEMYIFGQKTSTHDKRLKIVLDIEGLKKKSNFVQAWKEKDNYENNSKKEISNITPHIFSRQAFDEKIEDSNFLGWV